MACIEAIQRNQRVDCDKPLAKGVDPTVFLFMGDAQQAAYTFDTTEDNVLTNIAFGVTGSKIYAYEGVNYSVTPSVTLTVTDFDRTLGQTLTLKIFSNKASTKKEIQRLLSRVDLRIITKRIAGDYEVYGLKTGMRVSAFEYTPNGDDKGAYTVTFVAPDETALPYTFIHKTATVVDTAAFLLALTAADA